MMKIAAMAETYYTMVSPHNSNGPLSTVASLHFDMCVNNSHMQEIFLQSIPLYDEVLKKYPPQEFIPVESETYRAF